MDEKTQTKILLSALLVLGLIILAGGVYLGVKLSNAQRDYQNLLDDISTTHEFLTETLQRASSSKVDSERELLSLAEDNQIDISLIQRDLRSLGAKLEAIAVTTTGTKTLQKTKRPSDESTPRPDLPTDPPVLCKEDGRPIDVHGYTLRSESIYLEDSLGMKVGKASFLANQATPWSTRTYGLQYKIVNAISKGPRDSLHLHTELFIENPEAHPGASFAIPGISSSLVQVKRRPSFSWRDPRLTLGIGGGIGVHPTFQGTAQAYLGFSFLSYGSFRFLALSGGFDFINNTAIFSLAPFSYNIGDPLPLLSDLWLSPAVGVDHTGEISVSILLGTTL